jgi:hypothetical protein
MDASTSALTTAKSIVSASMDSEPKNLVLDIELHLKVLIASAISCLRFTRTF